MVNTLTRYEILCLIMELKIYIGHRVKAARQERGWTQQQLAERIGKAVETISNIERGHAQTGLETLEKISREFEIPLRDFFEGAERASSLSSARGSSELKIMQLVEELSDKELDIMLDLGNSLIKNRSAA